MDALTPLISGLNLHEIGLFGWGVRALVDGSQLTDLGLVSLGQQGTRFVHLPRWPEPLRLDTGDLILFLPHAARYFLSYSAEDLPDDDCDTRMAPWAEGDVGFVCGEIQLASPKSLLWQPLPVEIVILQSQAGTTLTRLLELVIAEASTPRFGSESVIERLCDSLLVLAIRHCIEQDWVREGVFAAMQDKRLAKALNLIHEQPWQNWTLSGLCSQAGVSKSVLSEKFAALIGHSPIEYLMLWRLQIAAHWLMEPNITMERVAERSGYESAPAFNKAFKRHIGVAPGAFRRI